MASPPHANTSAAMSCAAWSCGFFLIEKENIFRLVKQHPCGNIHAEAAASSELAANTLRLSEPLFSPLWRV